jgi:hypothetical protein
VKLEGDINQGVAYYKKALYYNWHYADAMYNLGVAYGEMLKFDMVSDSWGVNCFHLLSIQHVCLSFLLFTLRLLKNWRSYNQFFLL